MTIDAQKMPQSRHFGAGTDTMQQVHGVSVKSNNLFFAFDQGCREELIFSEMCGILGNNYKQLLMFSDEMGERNDRERIC